MERAGEAARQQRETTFVEIVLDKDGFHEAIAVEPAMEISLETIKLEDVGGLGQLEKRINEAFLEPMRHPVIAKAFGKSMRGGLDLYGPPDCGKT